MNPTVSAPFRTMKRLAIGGVLCAPLALAAAPVVVEIADYAVAKGTNASYFYGQLLTETSLSGDQQYQLGAKRYLGDPAQVLGDATLTLDDLFAADGRAGVRLSFDCAVVNCRTSSEPLLPADPHHDDLIFLDLQSGTGFGQLYLDGMRDPETGVYAELRGTFERVTPIPEPSSFALVASGLASLLLLKGVAARQGGSRRWWPPVDKFLTSAHAP